MKHYLTKLVLALMVVVSWGCSGSDAIPLTVKETELSFKADGGTMTIEVTGPDWDVVSSAEDWCVATREEKTNLVVTVAKNYAAKKRTAELLITSGAESQVVTVNQAKGTGVLEDAISVSSVAFPDMKPKGDELELPAIQKAHNFYVTLSNPAYTWRVVLDEENNFIDCDHLTAQRGSGYMTLNLQQNNTIDARKAKLQILCEYKGATGVYNLTIVQRATHNNEDPFLNDEIEW